MADDRMTRREWVLLSIATLAFVGLSGVEITRFPLPWWDEGWTLSVAKNWVTSGHYGHTINGALTGPTLSAHLPVVAIVAASFMLFGIGLAQARMAIVVCAALQLVSMYLLTRRLSSRNAAILAMILVTILPVQWDMSVLILSRNVLGEIPSLLFIFSGLLLLLRSQGERVGWLVLAGIVLGIALATKAQVMPFVVFALAVVALQVLIHDRRRGMRLLGVLASALVVMYGIGVLRQVVLSSPRSPADPIAGLADVTGMVFNLDIRYETLRFAVLTGAILTLSLGVRLLQTLKAFRRQPGPDWTEAVRSILILTAASWYGWYVLLSIGWGRYGFPAFVLAAPFAAELLLRLFAIIRTGVEPLDGRRVRPGLRFVAAGLLLFFSLAAVRQAWFGILALGGPMPPSGLEEVTGYLNRSTPQDATVETYDSEALFLLERAVHVPPAQVNVEFLRRNYLKESNSLSYDLDNVRADFLLVGTFSRGFYAPLIDRGAYVLVRRFGVYGLYRGTSGVR
jgi:4-amino-4-deoxy-L-arabinose transferase-like glycosyltransferase